MEKNMNIPTTKELLKAGAHFGHKKDKTHPKAKDLYTFGIRDGIYVIDLDKTQQKLKESLEFIQKTVKSGKTILFIGTKRQAKDTIEKIAKDVDMPYINYRWLGGMLTNFSTIKSRISNMISMEEKKKTSEYENLTKKEKSVYDKKLSKLQNSIGGIKNLNSLPDVMFIVDTVEENVAVSEAKKKQIPIIGICDVDANPADVDYVIPANDDSKPTIELILNLVKETILNSKK